MLSISVYWYYYLTYISPYDWVYSVQSEDYLSLVVERSHTYMGFAADCPILEIVTVWYSRL